MNEKKEGETIFLLKIVILMLALFILGSFLEKVLRKRFGIVKEKSFLYEYVNSIHKWGERTISLLFLISLAYVTFNSAPVVKIHHVFIIYILIFNGFRALMEWKYSITTNKYILTVMHLGLILIGILSLYSFNMINNS